MRLAKLLNSVGRFAAQRPDDVAIRTDAAVWTYGDLWRSSGEAARRLSRMEIRPGSGIAVCAIKSVETIALLLALGMRGHTPLIISPTLGSAAKAAVFDRAAVTCELAAVGTVGPGEGFEIRLSSKHAGGSVDMSDTAGDVPLLLTTSGTTGIPKAVRLSTEGVERFFEWCRQYFGIGPGVRILSYAPLNFDLSLLEIWAALDSGATVVLLDSERATDGDYLCRTLNDASPDVIQAVPMFFSLLAQAGKAGDTDVPAWSARHVILTGDVAPRHLRRDMAALFPQARFHNVYGCTETNDSFIHSCGPDEIAESDRLPIGVPIEGVEFRIVDDAGNDLDGAGQGELLVRTPFQSHGYTDDDLTGKVFVDCEGMQGRRRFYRTGDRVEREEAGALLLLGRTDLIVKVRGVRTNLQDVEHALILHPMVSGAVVVPVSDAIAGSVLHAIVRPKKQGAVKGLDLRKHCAEHLPQTAIPSRYIISSDPIPLTSTGKPDRQKLSIRLRELEVQ